MRYYLVFLLVFILGCGKRELEVANEALPDAATLFRDASNVEEDSAIEDVVITDVLSEPDAHHPLVAPLSGSFDHRNPETEPLIYQGGEVMVGNSNVYLIWYGDWSNKPTSQIIEYLVTNLNSSAWYDLHRRYYQQSVFRLPLKIEIDRLYVGDLHFGKSVYNDNYDYGNFLSKKEIVEIIKSANLPLEENAIYVVLTSEDVNESDAVDGGSVGFCEGFCAWHDYVEINNIGIKYAFVGDIARCPNECFVKSEYVVRKLKTPNADLSADGMASALVHELVESLTDPQPFSNVAWRDTYKFEIGDKCAYVYGDLYVTENQSIANVKVGEKDFLLQESWVLDDDNGNGHCGLHP